jgi:hypothetical protein
LRTAGPGEYMKRAFLLLAVVLLAVSIFGRPKSPQAPTTQPSVLAVKAASCEIGQAASGKLVSVTGSYELRKTPAANGDRIKNEKASSIIGSTQYHEIDSSTTVRQLCASGEWSQVQIVTPEWLTFVKGWVPNEVLRGIERTPSGARVYVDADFIWDDDTSKFKRQIVAVVNKIAQDRDGCSDLDTGSVALSPTRSKPGDPVFFVTCSPSGMPFNVWFRPTDAGAR